MLDERFSTGTSLLHTLDSRIKIINAALFTLTVSLTSSFTAALLALTGAVLLILMAALPLRDILKRILTVNFFTAFLLITLPFTYGKGAQSTDSFFAFSQQGLSLAILITIKTNAIVLTLIALLGTSPVSSLGHGLAAMHIPPRLCQLILFSYRYIFVIHQEYKRLHRAARMRCFTPATNVHTYRTYAYLLGMTLVKSWNRAARVQQAMVLRGFTGRFIPLSRQQTGKADYLFFSIFVSFLGLIFLTTLYSTDYASFSFY